MLTVNTHEALAGSWIVDAGPNQTKTLATYTPLGGGKYAAVESSLNFDWSLGGAKPTATHGTVMNGVVEAGSKQIDFVLISYALDDHEKAVYLVKVTGNKTFKDENTINVENMVFHFYNDPEAANPVTDPSDFTIPPSGTFPPVCEYRIRLK